MDSMDKSNHTWEAFSLPSFFSLCFLILLTVVETIRPFSEMQSQLTRKGNGLGFIDEGGVQRERLRRLNTEKAIKRYAPNPCGEIEKYWRSELATYRHVKLKESKKEIKSKGHTGGTTSWV